MDDLKKTKRQLISELSLLRVHAKQQEHLDAAPQHDNATVARLASFPHDNPHPVVEVELSGRVTYLNPAARRLFPDLTAEMSEIAHPWLADWESVAFRLQGTEPSTLLREVTIGGACYQQTMYKSGNYVRIYGVDITEYKKVQDALLKSEGRYRELVQNANSAIVRWACDGTVTFLNEYAQTLFGYNTSEIIGKNISILVPGIESTGGDLSRLVQGIVAHPEQFVNNINENVCQDGHRLWMAWTNKPIRDENGQVSEILAVGIDITERKRAEEQLRTTLESIGDGFFAVDGEWCFVYVNAPAERILGIKREEVLGRSHWDVFPLTQGTELERRYRLAASGHAQDWENFYEPWRRWFHNRCFPREGGGMSVYFREITEQKATEESQRESEQQLRQAFGLLEAVTTGAKILIATVDCGFHYTFFNQEHHEELKRLTGKDTIIGMSLMEVLADMPEDRDKALESWGRALNGETVVQTLEFGDPGHYRRWYSTRHTPIRSAAGEVIGAGEITSDITELKQAEMALRESEERFRRAIKEAPFPIMMHAEDGTVIAISDTWLGLTGYTPQDVSTVVSWTQKAFGERWPLVKAEFDRLYRLEEKVKQGEYTIITRSGETRMWDFSSTPLGILADGRHLVLSVAVDVTEHRQMEEALLQQNEYLAALQETMLDLATQLDLNKLLENIVKRAGQILRTSSGYLGLADPATGQIKHQVGLGVLSEMLECLAETGEDIVEMIWRTGAPAVMTDLSVQQYETGEEDGLPMACSAIGVPLLSGTRMLGILALACDAEANQQFDQADVALLTQLARLASIAIENAQLVETLRQTNAELKASNEELDAFGHTVAHDLKNPLGSIIGFANLLADEENPLPAETIRELARNFEELSLRMDNIIEELMLLAGLRKSAVKMGPLDMAHIVNEAQRRLTYMIKNAHAEIVDPPSWPPALGYASWVEEIWINYLSNAIKYGGRPPHIELGAARQGERVCFWVRDNGAGLTAEQQARLFQPFERLDQANLRGHGLGLSIVQRIAERMNGEVRVESTGVPGEGSTFCFVLPATDY